MMSSCPRRDGRTASPSPKLAGGSDTNVVLDRTVAARQKREDCANAIDEGPLGGTVSSTRR